jgi:hypothetical protein
MGGHLCSARNDNDGICRAMYDDSCAKTPPSGAGLQKSLNYAPKRNAGSKVFDLRARTSAFQAEAVDTTPTFHLPRALQPHHPRLKKHRLWRRLADWPNLERRAHLRLHGWPDSKLTNKPWRRRALRVPAIVIIHLPSDEYRSVVVLLSHWFLRDLAISTSFLRYFAAVSNWTSLH